MLKNRSEDVFSEHTDIIYQERAMVHASNKDIECMDSNGGLEVSLKP